jgi:acyl carrier protein
MDGKGAEAAAKILTSVLGRNRATPGSDTALFDIKDWDSLKHIQLVLEIETYLGASLDVADIEALVTVGDLRRLLSRRAAS